MFILRCHFNLIQKLNRTTAERHILRYFSIDSNRKSQKNTDKNRTNSKHTSTADDKQLTIGFSFEDVAVKNKKTYLDMVQIFETRDIRRRNHVEFIYAALRNMETFGVHRDLEIYKALINVLPKEKYIPRNMFQSEFMHYPKQQQCIIDVLEQMEDNGVIPDYEMQDILVNTFGRRGHPVLKYWRMMYWMPKFRNASPWLLPNPVPNDIFELAKLAIERMCTVDLNSKIIVYDTESVENAIDKTWIVSGMSPDQCDLLQQHNTKMPLYVEGPFVIWLRDRTVNYFILRGDPVIDKQSNKDENDQDDVSQLEVPQIGGLLINKQLAKKTTVHEQDDGIIYAICATGTSTKDSLLSWIRLMETDGNTVLGKIPILFKFTSSIASDKLVPVKV